MRRAAMLNWTRQSKVEPKAENRPLKPVRDDEKEQTVVAIRRAIHYTL
jgi:hypothetical protein